MSPRREPSPCVGCGGSKSPGRGRRWCESCIESGAPVQRKKALNGHKRRELFRRYGMRVSDFDALMDRQDGRCAICRRECGTGQHLCVDHDHETGAVRGLLCRRCNSGLGYMEDSDWMTNAAAYLLLAPIDDREPVSE